MIIRVLHKPDGGIVRTVVDYSRRDVQQSKTEIERLLKSYPESGWSQDEGYWARDTEGQKFTFEAH